MPIGRRGGDPFAVVRCNERVDADLALRVLGARGLRVHAPDHDLVIRARGGERLAVGHHGETAQLAAMAAVHRLLRDHAAPALRDRDIDRRPARPTVPRLGQIHERTICIAGNGRALPERNVARGDQRARAFLVRDRANALRLGIPIQDKRHHHANDEHREDRTDRRVAQATAAKRFARARIAELLLDRHQLTAVTRAPQLVLGQRLVAPQQAARPTALLPLSRCRAKLIAKPRALRVLTAPVDQSGPRREQRFVHYLHAVAANTFRGGKQARGDQLLEYGLRACLTSEHLEELGAGQYGARAIRGDQVAKPDAYEPLLVGWHLTEDTLGVLRERTTNAAERLVRLAGEPVVVAIAEIPHLRRGERQQRQRGGHLRDLVDHRHR